MFFRFAFRTQHDAPTGNVVSPFAVRDNAHPSARHLGDGVNPSEPVDELVEGVRWEVEGLGAGEPRGLVRGVVGVVVVDHAQERLANRRDEPS